MKRQSCCKNPEENIEEETMLITYIFNAQSREYTTRLNNLKKPTLFQLQNLAKIQNVNSYRHAACHSQVSRKATTPDPNMEEWIPLHQFSFMESNITRLCSRHSLLWVSKFLWKGKKYSKSIFLDVSRGFDKVWHPGLLFTTKQQNFLLNSYLPNREFKC